MVGDVLVLAETEDGELDSLSFEMLGLAREVADHLKAKVLVLLMGQGLEKAADTLSQNGADEVLLMEHPSLKHYNPKLYVRNVVEVIKRYKPNLFLLGYTHIGMEIGPAVASRLGAPLVSNCIGISIEKDSLRFVKPLYYGKICGKICVEKAEHIVVSVQKGAFPVKDLRGTKAPITRVAATIDEKTRVEVLEVIKQVKGEVDLTKAEIIVAGGRGLKEAKNIRLLKELADALGGVIACSRPLVDFGWLPPEYLVGLSGKTVRPKLYIAVGISGAPQHIVAMKDSKVIVAVNKDPSAPIFRIADYGIVGDLFQVVPILIEEAKRLKTTNPQILK